MTLKEYVYEKFSNRAMMALALIGTFLIVLEFLGFSEPYATIIIALNWIVWAVFVLEFVLKVAVEDDKTSYLRNNRLDSAISTVIILTPFASLAVANLTFVPATLRFLSYEGLAKSAVYGGKVVTEKQKITPKEPEELPPIPGDQNAKKGS